jgi:hypothetical protein
MTERQVDLNDLKGRAVDDVLREVVAQQEVLTVRLPEGDGIAIQPLPRLKPLPLLKGSVPEGWKDALYE